MVKVNDHGSAELSGETKLKESTKVGDEMKKNQRGQPALTH